MLVHELTKNEAKDIITSIIKNTQFENNINKIEFYFLDQISYYVWKHIDNKIKERQKAIPGVNVSCHEHCAVWNGTEDDLMPGCKICMKEGITPLRSVSTCELNCKYCYYYGEPPKTKLLHDHFYFNRKLMTADDIKILFDRHGKSKEGIAWVYYEFFEDFDKHPELIKYISEKGIHQWVYTNGLRVTEDQMKILHDSGLTEIRFNLSATGCSDKVISIMKLARKYFKYIGIDSPMYNGFYYDLIKNRKQILDTGVDQLNLYELHIYPNIVENFINESPFYQYKNGHISTVNSRQLTYNVMELAEKENWDVLINDCSNSRKYYRSYHIGCPFGYTDYKETLTLDYSWFLDAIERYPIPFKNFLQKNQEDTN